MTVKRRLLVMSHTFVTPVNRRIFEYLRQHTGWEVTLLSPSTWRNDYGEIVSPDVQSDFEGPVLRVPVLKRGSIPLHFYRQPLMSLLRSVRPHVVYAHNEPYSLSSSQLFAANDLGIRAIPGIYASQNIDKRYPLPIRLMRRRVLRRARFAFTISQEVLDLVRQQGFAGPAEVTPPGVDETLFSNPGARDELRTEMSIGHDEVAIAYIGRLVEEKGLLTLLRALARLQNLRWRLILVGTGPFAATVDRTAAELGISNRINRVGYVAHAELPVKFRAFDVLVLPSETRAHWKEQFGRVLVEALIAGVTVLGSSSGAIPEVIGATGGGMVFPEGDAGSLASCLEQLIRNPQMRESFVATGRPRALDLYSQKAIAKKMAAIMEEAIGSTEPASD